MILDLLQKKVAQKASKVPGGNVIFHDNKSNGILEIGRYPHFHPWKDRSHPHIWYYPLF